MTRHNRKSKTQAKTKMLIIGYWPLLPLPLPPELSGLLAGSETGKIIEQLAPLSLHTGEAKACLWLLDSETNKISPVFIYEEAEAIYKHLHTWSEGKPEEWFTLCHHRAENGYALVLTPNAQKSIDRMCLRAFLLHETVVNKDTTDFQIISQPLGIRSPSTATYDRVRATLTGGDQGRSCFTNRSRSVPAWAARGR